MLHALSGHFVRENPPITWQRVDAFRHAGWLQFKAASDCVRKGDSSDSRRTEQGLWEPDWLRLRVLHNLLLIYWDSHPITSVSGVDRVPEVAVVWRKKKCLVDVRGRRSSRPDVVVDHRKATGSQTTTNKPTERCGTFKREAVSRYLCPQQPLAKCKKVASECFFFLNAFVCDKEKVKFIYFT